MAEEMVAIDLKKRKRAWGYKPEKPAGFQGSVAVAGDAAIAVNNSGLVWAVSHTTGRLLWQFDSKESNSGCSPVIAGNRVIIPAGEHTLYVLDLKNGRRIEAIDVFDAVQGIACRGDRSRHRRHNGRGEIHCLGGKAEQPKEPELPARYGKSLAVLRQAHRRRSRLTRTLRPDHDEPAEPHPA